MKEAQTTTREDAPSADRQVPIKTAQLLCHAHGKRWMVIASCDQVDGRLYVTTYGAGAWDKEYSARLGDALGRMVSGSDAQTHFSDFRVCDQAEWAAERERFSRALDSLTAAVAAASNVLGPEHAEIREQATAAAAAIYTPYREMRPDSSVPNSPTLNPKP